MLSLRFLQEMETLLHFLWKSSCCSCLVCSDSDSADFFWCFLACFLTGYQVLILNLHQSHKKVKVKSKDITDVTLVYDEDERTNL